MRAWSWTGVSLSVLWVLSTGPATGEEIIITDQMAYPSIEVAQANPRSTLDDDLFGPPAESAPAGRRSPSLLVPGMRIPQPRTTSTPSLLDPFGTGAGRTTPGRRRPAESDLFLGPESDESTTPPDRTPTDPAIREPAVPRDSGPRIPTPAVPSPGTREAIESSPEFLEAPIVDEHRSTPRVPSVIPQLPGPSSVGNGVPVREAPIYSDTPIYSDAISDTAFLDGSMVIQASCDGCGGMGCGGQCGAGPNGGWFVQSWLSQGFTWNPESPNNGMNLPVTFNDFSNDYQMNQLYLSLGAEVVNYGLNWDFGARVDLLFGTDYFFTTARGLETHSDGSPKWNSEDGRRAAPGADYGLAMPQLYVEMYAPLGPGFTMKAGHFYTTLGFESVMAPENFFYSHAYTMQYGEPFTHTGILFDFPLSRSLRMNAGVTGGWDNFDDNNNEAGFLGGIAWTSSDCNTTFDFAITSGHEDDAAERSRTVYSMVLTRKLSSCMSYIAQSDFGSESQAQTTPTGRDSAKWYGLNQYLLYDLSNTLSTGVRFEWFRDQDNARVLALPIQSLVEGGNYYELTFGMNWRPRSFMTFRPELRWDWSDVTAPDLGRNGVFNDFTDKNQLTVAGDLILRF